MFAPEPAALALAAELAAAVRVAIEQVPLGARVPTRNPRRWEYDGSLPEPDEATWAKLSLTVQRSDGGLVDAELLRPRAWIELHGLRAGELLPLHLAELEVSGPALVTAIEACPTIAGGEGSVVIARFVTREVHVVASVEVLGPNGSVETITGTTIHPVWSVDREDWVPLGELIESETLQGLDGLAVVLSVTLSRVSQPVYNIEVHGEHVYQVGELGVLVHNAGPSCELGRSLTNDVKSAAASMRLSGYQAGHIVPWGAFSKRTLVVRDAISDAKTALRKAGVGLNESWNGFWTDSPRHLGTHTDIFFLTLGERLRGKQNRLEVLNILGILRDDILDGMFI